MAVLFRYFPVIPKIASIMISDKCKYYFFLSISSFWNSFNLAMNVKFENVCFRNHSKFEIPKSVLSVLFTNFWQVGFDYLCQPATYYSWKKLVIYWRFDWIFVSSSVPFTLHNAKYSISYTIFRFFCFFLAIGKLV